MYADKESSEHVSNISQPFQRLPQTSLRRMDGTELSDLFSEHALVQNLNDLKLDRSDFYIICQGELLCDKHGKFAGYPQRNTGPSRRDA